MEQNVPDFYDKAKKVFTKMMKKTVVFAGYTKLPEYVITNNCRGVSATLKDDASK